MLPVLLIASVIIGLLLAWSPRLYRSCLLLSAPALLLCGGLVICPAGACQPGAFDLAGLALAADAQGPLADGVFRLVTWAGSIAVLGPLALAHAVFAWQRQRALRAFFLPVALSGAALMAYVSKVVVARARPEVSALIEMPVDASFPSAHSLQISAFAAAWLLAAGPRGARQAVGQFAVAALVVALVAWSRLHLQVHYPSDILFALAAGTVWVMTLHQQAIWRTQA